MIKVTLLDDDQGDREILEKYLKRYQAENNISLNVFSCGNSLDFLETYRGDCDILILDIEMPGTNGMEVAREIRRIGGKEIILFITNLVQYAIQGYEVNAVDFILKPVKYFLFAEKIRKALEIMQKRQEKYVLLYDGSDVIKISVKDIYYLDKDRNYIVYHTAKGVFRERGTMQTAWEKIDSRMFSKCTSGCLVNFRYVSRVDKTNVFLTCGALPVSRGMRRKFLQEFMEYVGGGC